MELFKRYNHLGFHNPYYTKRDDNLIVKRDFEQALLDLDDSDRILDYTALVEVFSTGFCFSDRTLIKGLWKSPWMARPDANMADWDFYDVPRHFEKRLEKQTIVDTFYSVLKNELYDYIRPHKNIGLLLTGGMDSRIVAGILRSLEEAGEIDGKRIFTFTWGHELSRDVIYAQKIAKKFKWEWEHLVVDVGQLEQNCNIAIENGCEFTPIHLHAMPKVADKEYLDCVLAGSFGDSVGRAEFSGIKVRGLGNLMSKISNIGGILRYDFRDFTMSEIAEDIEKYHRLFPQSHLYQQYEQDQQLHYMRRMLNACMNTINNKTSLFQMFSAPSVFGFMWSLHPDLRGDWIYYKLIEKYFPEILPIPWARTGLPYYRDEGTPDQYLKKHHDYGSMIRNYFMDYVENALAKNREIAKSLFDLRAIDKLMRNLKKYPIAGGLLYEDRLLYVGQVLNFVQRYNIHIDLKPSKQTMIPSLTQDLKYKAKYFYKKVR